MKSIEETLNFKLDFKKIEKAAKACPGIIPVAIQNILTDEVILLAYTNKKAMLMTLKTGELCLWSTSRNKLWRKGAGSGHTFKVLEVYVNCEQNSLLYKVRAGKGGICHTNNRKGKPRNCFYRRIRPASLKLVNTDR